MTEPCIRKPSRQYSCVRRGGQAMRYEVQVEPAERRLEPVLTEQVRQRICRAAEKLNTVRMFEKGTDKQPNVRVYS